MMVATNMPYKGWGSFLLVRIIRYLLVGSVIAFIMAYITQPDFQARGDLALGNSVPRPKHDLQ